MITTDQIEAATAFIVALGVTIGLATTFIVQIKATLTAIMDELRGQGQVQAAHTADLAEIKAAVAPNQAADSANVATFPSLISPPPAPVPPA